VEEEMSKLFPKVQLPGEAAWCGNVTPNGRACAEGAQSPFWPNGVFGKGKFGTVSVGTTTADRPPPTGNRTGERSEGF
jgi:hypothetical protein